MANGLEKSESEGDINNTAPAPEKNDTGFLKDAFEQAEKVDDAMEEIKVRVSYLEKRAPYPLNMTVREAMVLRDSLSEIKIYPTSTHADIVTRLGSLSFYELVPLFESLNLNFVDQESEGRDPYDSSKVLIVALIDTLENKVLPALIKMERGNPNG
ncbi:hypothetical protein HOG48_05920 [Candidatus Peregrinibacteria bacterium]|nr:hypothetical protein [Candidatus Peregrinibacteria bacterium]